MLCLLSRRVKAKPLRWHVERRCMGLPAVQWASCCAVGQAHTSLKRAPLSGSSIMVAARVNSVPGGLALAVGSPLAPRCFLVGLTPPAPALLCMPQPPSATLPIMLWMLASSALMRAGSPLLRSQQLPALWSPALSTLQPHTDHTGVIRAGVHSQGTQGTHMQP